MDPELDAGPDCEVASAQASRVRYQVLAFTCALAVVTYIHRIGFAVGAPVIGVSLGLSQSQIGYLMLAFQVAYGLFQVPGGLLGDRLGGRRVLTILVRGWSLMIGAVALAVLLPGGLSLPFAYLLVLRFLFGMFQAGGFPTIGRVIADWMPITERGRAQGVDLDVQPLGRCADPVPADVALPRLRKLADPLPADRGTRAILVRRLLALVPRPARGNAASESRRAQDHRGRP